MIQHYSISLDNKYLYLLPQGNASPSDNSGAALQDDESKTTVDATAGTEIVAVDQTKVEAMVEEDKPVMKVKDDPSYKQYFRMLKIRVPVPHIKAKMAAHGLDLFIGRLDGSGRTITIKGDVYHSPSCCH